MSSARRQGQWRDACDGLVRLIDLLRSHGSTLLETTVTERFDGYPASASGSGSAGGGSEDPVGDRIAPLVDRDLDHAAVVEQMWAHLESARAWLKEAEQLGARAVPRVRVVREFSKPEAPGCVNCNRLEIYAVAVRAGRCWACYRYRLDHAGTDAPRRLIVVRAENATRRQLAQLAADGELPDSAAS